MKVGVPVANMVIPAERGRSALELRGGARLVFSDVEAQGGRDTGALVIDDVPEVPAPFSWNSLHAIRRLAVPFIGGLGDAIALLPVLAAITDHEPNIAIEVIAPPNAAQVFALTPVVARVHPHPATLETWCGFDSYLPLECIPQSGLTLDDGLAGAFARALGVPLRRRRHPLNLPPLESRHGGALVVIAVGDGASTRCAPPAYLRALVDELADQGVACVLIGLPDPAWRFTSRPEVLDLRGRTPSVLELTNCVRLSDAVVAHDSFLFHLAGALGRRTVGLFAPTSAGLAADYPTVTTIASPAPCAPCGACRETCPLGHSRCVAWDALSVARAVEATLEAVAGATLQH